MMRDLAIALVTNPDHPERAQTVIINLERVDLSTLSLDQFLNRYMKPAIWQILHNHLKAPMKPPTT